MNKSGVVSLALVFSLTLIVAALPSQAQITETYCSTDVPVLIPEGGGTSGPATSNLNVPEAGIITDVIVSMQIDHTFIADLEVDVISPMGTPVILFEDVGGAGDNLGTGCSPPNFILDDAAAVSVTTVGSNATGSYIPEQPLSTFDGQEQLGTWILDINDDAGGDVGQLNCWCLTITRSGSISVMVVINLSPPVATNPVFSTHTVTATVLENGLPLEGQLVDFEILSGPNAGLFSVPNSGDCSANSDCTTDADGQVSWTYFGDFRGTDRIMATAVGSPDGDIFSNTVEKTWIVVRNVPTLSEWGLIAMAGILGIAGLMVLRRKRVNA